MKIKRNVEVPKPKRNGEVRQAIVDFVESNDINMKLECGGKQEANRVYSSAKNIEKSSGLPIKVMRSFNDIYVIRKEN